MAARERLVEPGEVTAEFARTWWKALMANATTLVEDAVILAENSRPGRAQALLVLAMEELAKARWIYDAAQREWSAPLGLYGQPPSEPRPILVPNQLSARRLPHLDKLEAAEQFASGLGGFWNADRRHEYYSPDDLSTFEDAARRRNLDKQAGFYVDRMDDTILTPLAITTDGVVDFLMHAAQCVEMHLIEDHTRQQPPPTTVWSTRSRTSTGSCCAMHTPTTSRPSSTGPVVTRTVRSLTTLAECQDTHPVDLCHELLTTRDRRETETSEQSLSQHRRLLDDSGRTGVWPDSVQVIVGKLSMRLPTR